MHVGLLDRILLGFKRFFWPLTVIMVTALSFVAASLVSDTLAMRLSGGVDVPDVRPLPPDPSLVLETGRRNSLSNYSPVWDRNLFGTRGEEPDGPAVDVPAVTDVEEDDAVETALKVRLLGTVAGAPEDSLAIIQDQATKEVGVYRIEDTLLEVATVVGIEKRRVLIDNRGNLEKISMDDELEEGAGIAAVNRGRPSRPGRTRTIPSPPPPGRDQDQQDEPDELIDHEDDGITVLDDQHLEIERQYMDEQLTNLNSLLTQARVVPHVVLGKIRGYKIFAIKPNSLYARLGLRNGDVIQRINGREIQSPDKAFQLLQDLRYETNFEMDYMRNGQNQHMEYTIR